MIAAKAADPYAAQTRIAHARRPRARAAQSSPVTRRHHGPHRNDAPAEMLTEHDTRKDSRRARRQRAVSHGWAPSALPLRATLAEILRVKAERDDESGDRADEALMAMGGG